MEQQAAKFEQWAIVEVMGHRVYAGFVSEQAIGGASFVRVDVPEIAAEEGGEALPAFSKFFGAAAIYALTPCTEETARAMARRYSQRAFALYEAPRLPALAGPESATNPAASAAEDDGECEEDDQGPDYDRYDDDDE